LAVGNMLKTGSYFLGRKDRKLFSPGEKGKGWLGRLRWEVQQKGFKSREGSIDGRNRSWPIRFGGQNKRRRRIHQ